MTRALVIAVCLCVAPAVDAHTLSRSSSQWSLDGPRARVVAWLPVVEIARQRPAALGLDAHQILATPNLLTWLTTEPPTSLTTQGNDCRLVKRASAIAAGARRVEIRWQIECAEPLEPVVQSDLFFDGAPSHVHFVRLRVAGQRYEATLTTGHRVADFRARPSTSFVQHVSLGVHHVLIGLDHIVFVIVLMLLGGSLKTIILIATGFTVGHSFTLGLAAAGVVEAREAAVEVLVGLSIAYVALEAFHRWGLRRQALTANLALHAALLLLGFEPWVVAGSVLFTTCHLAVSRANAPHQTRERVVVAFAFGLIHGLAFASALGQVLEQRDLVGALLGFNLGVELGQIAVILATVALLWSVRRIAGDTAHQWTTTGLAAAALSTGVAWTLTRAAG